MGAGELLLITGPPAVGKMTVGRAVCARTAGTPGEWRLFHNHHTIEPLVEIFGYDTPPFRVLNGEFRRRVIEEAAAAGTRLIFSFVWDVDAVPDAEFVARLIAPYLRAGLRVSCVELEADLGTRLVRNLGADRIDHKRSKRDLAWSEAHLRERQSIRTNTSPGVPSAADAVLQDLPHLWLDNTDLSADDAAARILAWLSAD